MIAHFVIDEPRGSACWLHVDSGPFRYVSWVNTASAATPLTLAQASDYANAYGTRIDGVNRARVVALTVERAMPAMCLTERVSGKSAAVEPYGSDGWTGECT